MSAEAARPPASPVVYSVVVPVYKNEESLPEVVERLEWLQTRLAGPLEAVFVIDGSPDQSAAVLRRLLSASSLASQLVMHSRNFGSFAAIRTGLSVARGDYVAAMAADLQEPVELIETFFAKLATGEWDVAIGTRGKRNDPLATKVASRTYWRMYRRLVQPEMPPGGVDIFGCTRAVARQLVGMEESNSSLVGLLFWLGYRRVEIPYDRQERQHGKSAWSFHRKFRYLTDSVFSFTSLPITLILAVGMIGTAAAVLAAIVVLIAWLLGVIPVPGYTAQMLVMLFTSGSILFALGIVGTYVWRTFENSKKRPQSVVMLRETFGDE